MGELIKLVSDFLWQSFMLVVLSLSGVYLTIKTRFFPFVGAGEIMRATLGSFFRKKDGAVKAKGGVTPFQAAMAAVGACAGVGNIAGVSAAITIGGPGVLFWMTLGGLFSMATKYCEVALAVVFKPKPGGFPGPASYIEQGLKSPLAAKIFSFSCMAASFGVGNMVQANAVSVSLSGAYGLNPLLTGAVLALIVIFITSGSLKWVTKVTEKLVPVMCVLYLAACFAILFIYRAGIGGAFSLILSSAFRTKAVAGAAGGFTIRQAVRYGLSRGLFSHESGMGSSPIIHARADAKSPHHEGMWGIFEVGADLFMCVVTGMAVLSSGLAFSGGDSAALTAHVFASALGGAGSLLIVVSIFLFAVASMLCWCWYGENSAAHVFGGSKAAAGVYKLLFFAAIIVGSVAQIRLVWDLADLLCAVMAVVNIAAVTALAGKAAERLRGKD